MYWWDQTTAVPLCDHYCTDWLKMTSPAQDGNTPIWDILDLFFYSGTKWTCVIHIHTQSLVWSFSVHFWFPRVVINSYTTELQTIRATEHVYEEWQKHVNRFALLPLGAPLSVFASHSAHLDKHLRLAQPVSGRMDGKVTWPPLRINRSSLIGLVSRPEAEETGGIYLYTSSSTVLNLN